MTVQRPGNPVVRYDTSSLAANGPIEDREADKIVSGPRGDLCFFGVFEWVPSAGKLLDLLCFSLIPFLSLAVTRASTPQTYALSPTLLPCRMCLIACSVAALSHSHSDDRTLRFFTTGEPFSNLERVLLPVLEVLAVRYLQGRAISRGRHQPRCRRRSPQNCFRDARR